MLVQDINPGIGNGDIGRFTTSNGTLFFQADDGLNGRELWKLSTPEQIVTNSSNDIDELIAGGTLTGGQGNSLKKKLEAALDKLNSGNTTAAENKVNAFINQVNGLVNSGVLTTAEGGALIDAANSLINHIQS